MNPSVLEGPKSAMGQNAGGISHHVGQNYGDKADYFKSINVVAGKNRSCVVIENTECNFEKILSL